MSVITEASIGDLDLARAYVCEAIDQALDVDNVSLAQGLSAALLLMALEDRKRRTGLVCSFCGKEAQEHNNDCCGEVGHVEPL